MAQIGHIAVIGAGVMGSGIAAHAANAGAHVTLLDIDARLAAEGVERQIKTGGFMTASLAGQVRAGSVDDNIEWLADADWIIEAVAERLDIKQALYRKIAAVKKDSAVVSSNTSTIPLADLIAGLPQDFARAFMITHFFNPPRLMRLFELVAGPDTDPAAIAAIRDYADRQLGKGVVDCRDTPGFIGNRIGNYWLLLAQEQAIEHGLPIEEADAVMGAPFGIPRSGLFGLLDLVGIDLMSAIAASFFSTLPSSDPMRWITAVPQPVRAMIEQGRIGRKAGAGFYRLSADRKSREVMDFQKGDYRPVQRIGPNLLGELKAGPRALMESDTPVGRFASVVMRKTLAYAAALVPEIARSPEDVDRAMTLGYAWKEGPFAMIDRLGAGWLANHLRTHGETVPAFLALAERQGGFFTIEEGRRTCLLPDGHREPIEPAPGILSLPALKLREALARAGEQTSLWDLGEGVALLEMHAGVNALNPALVADIRDGLTAATETFGAVVIASSGANFSVGADLKRFLQLAEAGDRKAIDAAITGGQALMRAVKYAPMPVVAAVSGYALGGGCELALHSAAIVAHAETRMGLVEASVGLIPGWGGCKELLLRLKAEDADVVRGPVAPAIATFDLILRAVRTASAAEARELRFLSGRDETVMNIDRVLAQARAKALALMKNYHPPEPQTIALAGPSGAAALRNIIAVQADAGRISAHDEMIGNMLADVLTGGPSADPSAPLDEDTIMALERAAFMELIVSESSRDRIRHMLDTGKPLRN